MSDATTAQRDSRHTPVYFAKVRVENVRAFGTEATLNIADSDGRADRWTMIVGENATGKSTLLESIYWLRPVEHKWSDGDVTYFPALFELGFESEHSFTSDVINSRLDFLSMEAYVESTRRDPITHEKVGLNISQQGSNGEGFSRFFQVFAYTASRRVSSVNLSSTDGVDRVSFLRVDPQNIPSPIEALLKADYSERLGGTSRLSFKKLGRVACDLLPGVDAVKAGLEGASFPTILFVQAGTETSASQAGYGYLSTLAWVLDFAFKLAEAFPDLEDPLQAPAVCLVDEIDLHLHPQWQRTIVKTLLDTFPNVQFIVTAHSPIMVQASAGHNIVLLRRNSETGFVDIVNDMDEIANWSLDQIVTSSLFGFASAQAPSQAERVWRQTELLAKSDRSEAEEEELERLERAPQLPRGETEEEVRLNQRIADTLSRLQERLPSQ